MNYLLKNSRRRNGGWKQLLVACTILAVAGVFYFFAPRFISNSVFNIARPIWSATDYLGEQFTKLFAMIANKERLTKLNDILGQELFEAQVALQDLSAYKQENEQLKSMLGRAGTEKRILSSIMAKPNHSLYDTLLLDTGEQDNVTIGDKVLAGDFVIGTVREVNKRYSKATLYSSPGEVTSVLIGSSNIVADATGRGAGNFIVKVPKEIVVNEGDLIRMPGLNPRFFGTVSSIEQTVTGSFQLILFHLPVNINNLRWIEIGKS